MWRFNKLNVTVLGLLSLSMTAVASGIKSGYEQVYAIQVAAYNLTDAGERFVRKHGDIPLTCRIKDNGQFAIYYGQYQTRDSAREHLQDYPLLIESGAYVVALSNVQFHPCAGLSETIEKEQKSLYKDKPCSGCSASELVDDYLQAPQPQ